MGKLDDFYDRIYQLKVIKDSLDRFRTTERDEYDQRINELKKQMMLLKNPPPEKRVIIDQILALRSDLSIIYTEPIVELSSFTVEQLQYHLERCKKGYRFFTDEQVKRLKAEKSQKFGLKKAYPPSIKDLLLAALKEKDHTLVELLARIPGNQQTIKATLTYHLKKQGYNIEVIKEGIVEKYRLSGYLDLNSKESDFVYVDEEVVNIKEIKKAQPPPPVIVKASYPKEGVFNFIVKLMQEKSYTIEELAALSGASLSTIKQNISYTAKHKGVIIRPVAEAGYSTLKYMIKTSTGE